MKVATRDRGEIIHHAGRRGLSPALRDGVPVLVSGHDATATRCGWETFFRAMEDRGLALVHDPHDEGGDAELRPAAGARDLRAGHGGLGAALDHARRFWRALFPGGGRTARAEGSTPPG
jgi:hypothetical protein